MTSRFKNKVRYAKTLIFCYSYYFYTNIHLFFAHELFVIWFRRYTEISRPTQGYVYCVLRVFVFQFNTRLLAQRSVCLCACSCIIWYNTAGILLYTWEKIISKHFKYSNSFEYHTSPRLTGNNKFCHLCSRTNNFCTVSHPYRFLNASYKICTDFVCV